MSNSLDFDPELGEEGTDSLAFDATVTMAVRPSPRTLSQAKGQESESDSDSELEADEHQPLLGSSDEDFTDTVQFSAPMYYVDETEGVALIDLIRVGTLKGHVSVGYSTKEGTAKVGEHYYETKGRVTFAPGEHTKTIEVKLVDNEVWNSWAEFRVTLSHASQCKLDVHHRIARVKVTNDDTFPTHEYDPQVQQGTKGIQSIGAWNLFFSYVKFNYECGGVKWQTILSLILDQVSNVCLFVTLYVGVYMVDTLFARGTAKKMNFSKYNTALMIASWYVIPVLMVYAWEMCKVKLDIRGKTKQFLQISMIRTYLEYTPSSLCRVSASDLNITISSSADLVAGSYVAALNMGQCLGKIFTVLLFIFLYQPDMIAFVKALLMPLLLFLYLMSRVGAFQRVQTVVDAKMRDLVILINDICNKYSLIAEYRKRPAMSDIFEGAADDHTKASIPVTFVKLNTFYATKFLSGFFIATYIIMQAPAVLDGHLSLGLFLATIAIYGTYLADALTDLNNHLTAIMESFTSLEDFTLFLNLPLELPDLHKLHGQRRDDTMKTREEALRKRAEEGGENKGPPPAHTMKIKMVDVSLDISGKQILKNANFEVDQGTMIAVVGNHASGKRTFLRLMADLMLPTSGYVFVPSHLRVRFVSCEPMFLNMSLLDNLTLGLANQNRVDMPRVKYILKLMKMPHVAKILDYECRHGSGSGSATAAMQRSASQQAAQQTIGQADAVVKIGDGRTGFVSEFLSHSELAKIHIARALIADPDVLILDHPLKSFKGDVANELLQVFCEHVNNRGLGYNDGANAKMNAQMTTQISMAGSRRPRTMFFSSENLEQTQQADGILHIEDQMVSLAMNSNKTRRMTVDIASVAQSTSTFGSLL